MADYRVTIEEDNGCLDNIGAGCTILGCLGCSSLFFGGMGAGTVAGIGLISAIKKLFAKRKA